MISNPADKSKCVACETPNPAAPPDIKSDDLMSKFMTKPSDKWTCDVCMISNTADKFKCAACETPKPGGGGEEAAAAAAPKATFNFGDGGGFKFESSDNATKSDAPLSGFKFGSVAPVATEAAPASLGGFKFGASETPTTAPAFGFGATTQADRPAGGFKFGVDATPTATGFKFGSSEAPPAVTNPLFQGPTGFKFSPTEKVQNSDRLESLNIYHLIT
jgi:nuclear pore complex protein Nup153